MEIRCSRLNSRMRSPLIICNWIKLPPYWKNTGSRHLIKKNNCWRIGLRTSLFLISFACHHSSTEHPCVIIVIPLMHLRIRWDGMWSFVVIPTSHQSSCCWSKQYLWIAGLDCKTAFTLIWVRLPSCFPSSLFFLVLLGPGMCVVSGWDSCRLSSSAFSSSGSHWSLSSSGSHWSSLSSSSACSSSLS